VVFAVLVLPRVSAAPLESLSIDPVVELGLGVALVLALLAESSVSSGRMTGSVKHAVMRSDSRPVCNQGRDEIVRRIKVMARYGGERP